MEWEGQGKVFLALVGLYAVEGRRPFPFPFPTHVVLYPQAMPRLGFSVLSRGHSATPTCTGAGACAEGLSIKMIKRFFSWLSEASHDQAILLESSLTSQPPSALISLQSGNLKAAWLAPSN